MKNPGEGLGWAQPGSRTQPGSEKGREPRTGTAVYSRRGEETGGLREAAGVGYTRRTGRRRGEEQRKSR